MKTTYILYQDNKPTILLATSGRILADKANRHIHQGFFLIIDNNEMDDLAIEHRGAKEMWLLRWQYQAPARGWVYVDCLDPIISWEYRMATYVMMISKR